MAHDIQNFENQLCTSSVHFANGKEMFSNFPAGTQQVQLGMGCFWGAERILWKLDGVHVTSVGYAGGHTPDPDYKKTCTGTTGHAEMVHVTYDPKVISFDEILKVFFEKKITTRPKATAKAMIAARNIAALFSPIRRIRCLKPKRP